MPKVPDLHYKRDFQPWTSLHAATRQAYWRPTTEKATRLTARRQLKQTAVKSDSLVRSDYHHPVLRAKLRGISPEEW